MAELPGASTNAAELQKPLSPALRNPPADELQSQRNSQHTSPPSPPSKTLRLQGTFRRYVHLDGGRYFFNREMRLVTLCDVNDPTILRGLLKCRHQFGQDLKPAEEMVIGAHGGSFAAIIYNWEEGKVRLDPGKYKPDDRHLRTSFWSIVERFPMHHRKLPPGAEVDFLSALTFGASERIFDNKCTTFPFTDDQSQRLVQIYRDLKIRGNEHPGEDIMPALIWHVARVMVEIEKNRTLYGYDTSEPRIHRNERIPKMTWKVQLLDFLLVFVLFGAHASYRKRLQSIRPKGVVYLPDFQSQIKDLLLEWGDSNLLATVFVSANMAFLAVPGLNGLEKTASLASSLFGLMSIASGVHHVWRHRGKEHVRAGEAARYLDHFKRFGEHLGTTITACLLSLPLVSLLWSVLAFAVAVAAYCIEASGFSAKVLLIIVLGIISICACATLAFFWQVWNIPLDVDFEEDFKMNTLDYPPPPLTFVGRIRAVLLKLRGKKGSEPDSSAEKGSEESESSEGSEDDTST